MLLSILYLLLRRLLGLARRSDVVARDIENAVLRHQLKVLRRQASRPKYRPGDRLFLAAASRLLPRERWSAFLVTPQTLVRWHRELVKRKMDLPTEREARPACDRPRSFGT